MEESRLHKIPSANLGGVDEGLLLKANPSRLFQEYSCLYNYLPLTTGQTYRHSCIGKCEKGQPLNTPVQRYVSHTLAPHVPRA